MRVELIRAIRRSDASLSVVDANRFVAGIHLIRMSEALLDRAAFLEPVTVRTLDSIHLAAALSLGSDLGVILTYDTRMIEAAASLGLATLSPG